MQLSLTMLGAFEVRADGAVIPATAWKLRHPRELLQMVALSPGQRLSRELALQSLWPNADPQAASNRLYHTTHLLRSTFSGAGLPKSEPVLLLTGDVLQINPAIDCAVDVCQFRALIEQSRRLPLAPALSAAIALYQGELLSGFACSDWLAPLREACRIDYVWALNCLAGLRREANDPERAIGLYQKLLDAEPADELAHRALMELFDLTEHPERAVHQFAACKSALRRDLDVDPSPATLATVERIVAAARTRMTESRDVVPADRPRYVAPAHAIPMVGRDEDLAALHTWLARDGVRLMTITGAAGLGKTRLAHALLEHSQKEFEDGVLVVPLTNVESSAQVVGELIGALGVSHSGRPALERLGAHLRKRRMLLLLDRFEHIVEAGAVISQLLAAAPGLVVVVTSQVPLRLANERVYRLPSLVERRSEDAVQLFCKVASNVNVHIEHPDDLALVASICLRLGGNALAIHLAARQTQLLSVSQMVHELETPLDLLVTTLRDGEAQHRSLRQAIAWAHSLLDPGGRRLFALIGVFRSTFATDDAVEVLASFFARDALRSGLADLVERSLVSLSTATAHDHRGGARLLLLDSLAQFARDKLLESGEAEALERAHARHFAQSAQRLFERVRGGDGKSAAALLRVDRSNLLAAVAWHREHADAVTYLTLVLSVSTVAAVAGAITDAADLLQEALERRSEATVEERRLSAWCAYRLARTYAWRATRQTDIAIRHARRLSKDIDDPELRNKIVTHLANDHLNKGKPRIATALLGRLIGQHEASHDSRSLVGNYGLLATAQHGLGDTRAALASAEAAVRHARAAEQPQLLAYALMVQCEECTRAGDIAAARRALDGVALLPAACISLLRQLHLRLLDCYIDLEGAEFDVALGKLLALRGDVMAPERVRTRAFVDISCDLVAIEQGRCDLVTTLDSWSLSSLPRNPAFDDLCIRLLCARMRVFDARGEHHKVSQSLRQLLDRVDGVKSRMWFSWVFEACALVLLERAAWPECRSLIELSKGFLIGSGASPTPRQSRNWERIDCGIAASLAPLPAGRPLMALDGVDLEFDSPERAVQFLRHSVLGWLSGDPTASGIAA
jgi:predicted ATPase/DNA-binding SARP family transcriptional activator